ncbi:MAG: VOC family protein [Ilumatobacteraceae bacterium]
MTDYSRPRFGLVLDCSDPHRLAEFWAAALDYVNVGAAGAYVSLYPRDGNGPKLLLQAVTDTKTVKNRMHIDVIAADIEVEAGRLIGLGARRTSTGICQEHGSSWIAMVDPDGNEFCICDGGTTSEPCDG